MHELFESVPRLSLIEKDKLLHCLTMLYWKVFMMYSSSNNKITVQETQINLLKNSITVNNKDFELTKNTNEDLFEKNENWNLRIIFFSFFKTGA